MATVALKGTIAIAAALLGAWLLRSHRLAAASDRSFLLQVVLVQIACSLGLFSALYVIGHQQVTSDVPGAYIPQAHAALAGGLIYRDFASSYAPLFPYFSAVLMSIWNSGKIFALCAIALNVVTLVLWHSAAATCLSPSTVRRCSIFFATSGHVILQALLGVQQLWIAAALAASACLLTRRHELYSGLFQALALCATKFLVVLFWPVMTICAPSRLRWLVAALVPSIVIYVAFALQGADPLLPLHSEGGLISSGNLPYLLDPLVETLRGGPDVLGVPIFDIAAIVALAITTIWLFAQSLRLPLEARSTLLIAGIAITGLVFMLASKKSFTGYEVFFMYPAIALLEFPAKARRGRGAFLLVFNILLASEPSLWFHLHGEGSSLRSWWDRAGGPVVIGFVLVDLALIGCYGYLLGQGLQCVRVMQGRTNRIMEAAEAASA